MRQTIEGSEISRSVFGPGNRTRTLKQTTGATFNITPGMPGILFLNCATATNAVLPAAADGAIYVIVNVGAGTITVQNPALATVVTLATGTAGTVAGNGTTWFAIGSSVA